MSESPACTGHPPCDGCATCARGRCCRKDNPDYRLPPLGSIPVFFGSLGVRRDVGDKVECHICGDFFMSIGSHSWAIHDVTVAEYRSAFGLGPKGLVSADYRLKLSARAKANPRTLPSIRPTSEQRRAGLESLETRRKMAESRVSVLPQLMAKAHAPATVERMRATKRAQHIEYVEGRSCVVCGESFEVERYKSTPTCSPECETTRKSAAASATARRRIAEGTNFGGGHGGPGGGGRPSEAGIRAIGDKARQRWATAPLSARVAAATRLAAWQERVGPTEVARQRQRAGKARADQNRQPHYCTNGCGTLIPSATPKTCSPECRREVRQRTIRAALLSR